MIGLYLNPPDKALVLCCDEKSQCQALERTQPGLPLGIGHIRTKTHDYVRHGTLTLFAALNYLEGKLITRLAPRYRHQEWLAFLKTIDEQTPGDLDIHIIADNYATHKHPAVTRWLDRHTRFHMHYTLTSSSWMNLVERFFRDLTEFITEKSFASTRELADAIIAFLAARNENPRRYVWKAKGEEILRKINAARQALAAATLKELYFRDDTLVVSKKLRNSLKHDYKLMEIWVYQATAGEQVEMLERREEVRDCSHGAHSLSPCPLSTARQFRGIAN